MLVLKGVKSELDVKIAVEVDSDLGRTTQVKFIARFRKPGITEAKTLMDRLSSDEGVDEQTLMQEYLLGWRDVVDDSGEPVEFSEENVNAMLEAREYRSALSSALLSVVLGKQALAKNS